MDYLVDIGASSLLSTRMATIQRANKAGLLTMLKVFVTDRSTWPRSVKAIEQSDPNLVQIMPAPMLAHISEAEKQSMPPIVASGFICNQEHVALALRSGACAVSSSDAELWSRAT
ncbi:Glycerol-3-phosphate responsive antiterminator [compost metagenome]